MIRIVLVDDQTLVRNGLKYLLETNPEYKVIAEASNLKESLEILKKNKADLLITEVNIEESCGIELTRQASVLFPKLKIIILSTFNCYEYVRDAINSGVNGYFFKECTEQELFYGISKIMNNESYFCKSINQILKKFSGQNLPQMNNYNNSLDFQKETVHLTRREEEILKLINAGYINKEIAAHLFLSVRTVDKHRFNILQKFKVNNTAKLLNKVNQLKQDMYVNSYNTEKS